MARQWHSLTPRRAFLEVGSDGAKIFSHTVQLQICAAGEEGWTVGFTVSRRHGGAVVRNRIKRRLRAAMDAAFADARMAKLLHRQGARAVVIARQGAADAAYAKLMGDMHYCLKKALKALEKTERDAP